MMGAHGGLLAFLRDHLVPLFGETQPVQRFITEFVSELGIDYRSSSLTLADRLTGSARAGNRAPDALVYVWPAEGEKPHPARIFDLIDPAKFTLLMFDPDSPDDRSRNAAAAAAIAQALPMTFKAWHVSDSEEPDIEAAYGSERPSFCLIRPDGYVMLRGTPSDAVAAADFCRRAFDRPRL
jgi:3-(3-hydroxy-phenyl)propionate hydroxylase